MKVLLPQAALTGNEKTLLPTLYLLHGLSDNETTWTRRTSLERYVEDYNLAVVMPTTHRGWYTDAKQGYRYYTHVAEEVPQIARVFFPLSAKREDNFIAGLSMGGYGALKIALRNPETFYAAASMSGAVDIGPRMAEVLGQEMRDELERIFGSIAEVKGSENDIFHLLNKLAKLSATTEKSDGVFPKIFQACGTEDFLHAANLRLRDHINSLECDIDYTYTEGTGSHNWEYWDQMIRKILQWLPLRKNA